MDISKVMNIISLMPIKQQKLIMAAARFDGRPTSKVWDDIINTAISVCRNGQQREILQIYKSMPVPDDIIESAFGTMQAAQSPLTFDDEQINWISERIYRNRDGEFRIIPMNTKSDDMPVDGLKADEEVIQARLTTTRMSPAGHLEIFDGYKQLRQQHYEGPYDGVFHVLAPNLQRFHLHSSFEPGVPSGFYRSDNKIHRNIAYQIETVNPKYVSDVNLRRALLLMYLVAGANNVNWQTLYALIHFIVRVPNSSMGYIIYLNDFDAGGNGKSKFVSMLMHMFGDSFTAFEPHQLRFNISLMGKRLVHISEYEDNETSRQLMGMLKSMTGRDKFQYEGKGVDPVVAETYQNFVISSNKYIYFEDAAIKRRLQNFHCSNFLHLLLTKHYHSAKFLNPLFGNYLNGESFEITKGMAHSLLDFIQKDSNEYDILLRPQTFVLGSLKNPILRALFAIGFDPSGCIRETESGCCMDLPRVCWDAKPEQYNYAAATLANWLNDVDIKISRDSTTLAIAKPEPVFRKILLDRTQELDTLSKKLRAKSAVFLEDAELAGFRSRDLLQEFFEVRAEETEGGLLVS